MNYPKTFTIQQTKQIHELTQEGYKIKKLDGRGSITLKKENITWTINN